MAEMTPEWIAEIRERCEKATGEPLARSRYAHGGGRMFRDGEAGERFLVLDAHGEADREFYFAARADVADLLDALSRAQQEIADLKKWVAESDCCYGGSCIAGEVERRLAALTARPSE